MEFTYIKPIAPFKVLASSATRYTQSEIDDAPSRNYQFDTPDSTFTITEVKESDEPSVEGVYLYELTMRPNPMTMPIQTS